MSSPEPGFASFENTLSWSAGVEYRLSVYETKRLFLRAGWKSYDTPWGSESDLPAVGLSQLRIDTKGDRLNILTLGTGLYWTRKSPEGVVRMSGLDVAVELFGETNLLMGASFTYQLD